MNWATKSVVLFEKSINHCLFKFNNDIFIQYMLGHNIQKWLLESTSLAIANSHLIFVSLF